MSFQVKYAEIKQTAMSEEPAKFSGNLYDDLTKLGFGKVMEFKNGFGMKLSYGDRLDKKLISTLLKISDAYNYNLNIELVNNSIMVFFS